MESVFALSMKLLLHDLNLSYEPADIIDENPSFSGYSLYTPDMEWKNSHLVIGMLTDLLPAIKEHPEAYFLCIRDRFADEGEEVHKNSRLLILLTNRRLPWLFNKVLAIHAFYQHWDMQMRLSTLSNQGLQPLIDLTETVIGNHIDIMDATFTLMGYTHNIELDDPITEELLFHGYHSDETMERFLQLRRFEQFETEDDVIISDDYKLCKYVSVKRVFHSDGKPSMYVIMHCNHREADDSLIDLFRIFLRYVEHYAKKEQLHPSIFAASVQYLRSLFDGTIKNVDEAISRAAYATIPFQQDYLLYLLSFRDHFNAPLEKLAADINQNLPFSYVLTYNRRIIILQSLVNAKDSSDQVQDVLNRLLKRYPCIMGISNPFSNLWEAKTALEQAGCAIEYGAHIQRISLSGTGKASERPGANKPASSLPGTDKASEIPGANEPASSLPDQSGNHTRTSRKAPDRSDAIIPFTFEECILTLLVTKSYNSTPDLFRNSFLFQAVETLLDYDREHSSHLLETLSTWLECGQKATETSERLHMHRNTVLYHIDRIEKLLGITLNDPDIRTKLYIGIKTFQSNMIEMLL